jgi:hypothetical protein
LPAAMSKYSLCALPVLAEAGRFAMGPKVLSSQGWQFAQDRKLLHIPVVLYSPSSHSFPVLRV